MRRFVLRTLLLGALVGILAPGVGAQVDDREASLERIRGEIARLQAELTRVQREASSVAGEYDKTRLELEIQEQRVAEAQAAQDVAQGRVTSLEERVAELEAALEEVRSDLKGRLGALYRLGRGGYLRLVLSLGAGSDALPALRQLRYLARRDGRSLDRYTETRARLLVEREELTVERERVEGWVAEEESRRSRLHEIESRQSRLLARLRAERSSLQEEREELADKERKLSNFLGLLYGQTEELTGTPIQSFRGVLDWPVRARVAIPFGPRIDPRYKTRTPHNGLELETTTGGEIKAVYPGKVLFAAPFKGYGPTVIVNHPDRAFTLYAGLGDLRVGVDDVIALGQVVGTASDALYFEIRVENRPEDPRSWLRE